MKKDVIHNYRQKSNKFYFGSVKIIALFTTVIILLATAACLAWLNHRDFENAIVSQVHNQFFLLAKSQAQSIEEVLTDIYEELMITSQQPAIRALLKSTAQPGTGPHKSLLEDAYKDIQNLTESLCLLNTKGIVLDAVPGGSVSLGEDLSSLDEIKHTMTHPQAFFGDVFKLSGEKLAIAYYYPIIDQEKIIGSLRAVIELEKIQRLVNHINQLGLIKAFLVDDSQVLISYPDQRYIGNNLKEVIPDFYRSNSARFSKKIKNGDEGKDVIFFSVSKKTPIEKNLIAFVPVRIGAKVWSIVIFMPYAEISGPLNRNLLDSAFFVGFVLFIFMIAGTILYIMQQKRTKLEIESLALNIINKELHADIAERKNIEENFYKSFSRKIKK